MVEHGGRCFFLEGFRVADVLYAVFQRVRFAGQFPFRAAAGASLSATLTLSPFGSDRSHLVFGTRSDWYAVRARALLRREGCDREV